MPKPTETIDLAKRGLLLGRLQLPESQGELIIVQQTSRKIIDPLREEIGSQGNSLITATPDDLRDMQTLDAQIAHYRIEVLKRGVSELELNTLIERVVEKILGAKVERRSILQGMKHLILHRSLIRDILIQLLKRPSVLMPKSAVGILAGGDVEIYTDKFGNTRYRIPLIDGKYLQIEDHHISTHIGIHAPLKDDILYLKKAFNIHNQDSSGGMYCNSSGETALSLRCPIPNSEKWIWHHDAQITPEMEEVLKLREIPDSVIHELKTHERLEADTEQIRQDMLAFKRQFADVLPIINLLCQSSK